MSNMIQISQINLKILKGILGTKSMNNDFSTDYLSFGMHWTGRVGIDT